MEDVGGQGFSVVGNAPLLDRLRRDVREGRLNHAYILDGAPGSGRHTLARWLCGAIACRNRPGQRTAADENQLGMFDSLPPVQPPADAPLPCGRCEDCRRILEGISPDVRVIGREGKATLGVDSVRFLRQDVLNPPNRLDTKIYIIEDAETMTVQAQNALLLTLEEPPAYVLFLLLCNGTDALLETVRSRAPVLRLAPLPDEDVRDALAAHGRRLSEEETAALLLQANGSIGRALALSDPRTLAPILRNRERCEALLACLADRRADEIMTAIYGWDAKRDAVCDILADLHLAVRDLVLLKRTEDIRTVFFTDRDAAADLADRFTSRALIRLYDAVWKARGALESNGNVRLTLTRMAQEISHA